MIKLLIFYYISSDVAIGPQNSPSLNWNTCIASNDFLLFLAPLFLLIWFKLFLFFAKEWGGGGAKAPQPPSPPAPPSARSLKFCGFCVSVLSFGSSCGFCVSVLGFVSSCGFCVSVLTFV